jgi:tRNA G18 (ribose-2'-O)-methylase SpoU
VDWEYCSTTLEAITRLNAEGVYCCALEQVENSTPLQQFQPQKGSKYALIFGNEVFGVEEEVLKACDEVLEIPQLGTKHSLNISVTLGIAVWDMMVKLGEIS